MLGLQSNLVSSTSASMKQPHALNAPWASASMTASTSSLGSTSSMQGTSVQSSSIDEKSLKDIIEIIDRNVMKIKNLREFSTVLQIDSINAPTISGHTDAYYPNLSYQSHHFQSDLPEISKIKHIPIPNELFEQFAQMQSTCYMGVFTCITRAWITIDNLIFFWNYEDGSDLCFYDNLNEPILAVELFVPKAGTFDDGVEYGLCLATSNSVILISIDFIRYTKGNGAIVNELRFSAQPVYTITLDNLVIKTLKSSPTTGRIFMGAGDGCLYEFFYQNQTSWFSSQTKKINLSQSKFHYLVPSFFNFSEADSIIQIELDETRNVLYTRSENSTIQVFYLGPNGMETSKISCLTCSSIASKAAGLVSSNDKHLFMPIVNISSIKRTESRNICLVGVTQFGIRLYFSLYNFDQFHSMNGTATSQQQSSASVTDQSQIHMQQHQQPNVPATFQLVHVRIPPNIDLAQSQNRAGPICSSYTNDGITLMITKKDEQTDSVLMLNRDLFLLHNIFKESKSIFDVNGRIWSVEEIVPSLNSIKIAASENELLQTAKSASGQQCISKLTAEYFDMPRRFVMVTPQGCFIWNKLRPVDQLTIVLKESNGPHSEAVKLFFNKIYERSEACSLCLAVALMHSNDNRLYEWATHAYFLYSGDAEIRKKSAFGFGASSNAPLATNTQYGMSSQAPFMQSQPVAYLNPQSTLLGDLGTEQNENSIYGDMTLAHNRFLGIQQQQQQQQLMANKPGYGLTSFLNSPQQMSTPIVMRTKEQQQQAANYAMGLSQAASSLQTPANQYRNSPASYQSQLDTKPMVAQQFQKSECEIYFSGKHDALYIYLSRLLEPIWELKLLNEISLNRNDQQTDEQFLFATFNDINIQWYLNKLNELKHFIDSNFPHLKTLQHSYLTSSLFSQLQPGATAAVAAGQSATTQSKFATQFSSMPLNVHTLMSLTTASSHPGNPHQHHHGPISEERLASEIENGSIFLIRQFINRMTEIFGLWKILEDHQFHFISAKLDKQTQLLMINMQIRTFLLADDALLEQLITALLYRYIDDNACTDTLNQSLKQMCPSLYTNENAIFSKACEKLKQALNIKNDSYERDRLLKEAVDLMKQIGYVANLTHVCDMLYSAGCYEAIFELCLTAAQKRDPQNVALFYYRKNEPVEDVQGQSYFNLRAECYKCMLECLSMLVKTPNVSFAQTSGVAQPSQIRINVKEKLDEQINYLINYVISSTDELAHVNLFNWMINMGYEKKLVTLNSNFLEAYLLREIKEQTKNRIYLDLLWRHYEYKKDYINAAKVLTALAEKYCESQITLKERVEYLTQAIVMLNSSNKSSVKDETSELSDKKDVALLQEQIYYELSKLDTKNENVQEALLSLDSQLYDITRLFYDFAEKFDLFQCQLAIFKTSRHDEPKAVELLWKQIIANELDKLLRPEIKPSDLKNELAENIVCIAKEYVDDDDEKYFPLAVLIDSLEFVSLSRGFEPEWGVNLLRKLNVRFDKLIHAYDSVYLKKDIKWAENLSRFINAIFCLVEIFVKAPNATNDIDKKLFIKSVRDLIPKYQTQLNAINDDLSVELIDKFKSLSYMLERM